jgi:3-oxoacyl-(acyl-carrier-protein) synthase
VKRVVISGIGFASSIGLGRAEVLSSLRHLRHGLVRRQIAGEGLGPEIVVGSVDGFFLESCESRDWEFPGKERFDPVFLRGLPPHGPYAVVALEEALGDAGLAPHELNDGRTGLFCASPGSPRMLHYRIDRLAASGWKRADPMAVVSSVPGTLNFNLAAHYGITGANCGFVSACTSSSHALGYAFDEIALGRQDRILLVSAEDGDAASILPFAGMRALSTNPDPESASRPFDCKRDGFVGTGGGVALILESAESVERRGRTPLAEMRGWGQASDGYSIAVPHPEGRGIRAAMEQCLHSAGEEPASVDWINAHATSTPAGDRAEALAIRALGFGNAGTSTRVSSTKGLTGHGLSHAGALEAALSVLSLEKQIIPGNAALSEPDPACEGLLLPTHTEETDVRLVLNNSSGFGGSNVCHLFARP